MEPTIKNMSIVTNEISYRTNNLPDGYFEMIPNIRRKFGKLNSETNKYGVELMVLIEDHPEHRSPINLRVRITGVFEIEGENCEEEINNFLKQQGLQIVYPYLRSMVSSITASALVPPIMLPIINVLDFKDEIEEK